MNGSQLLYALNSLGIHGDVLPWDAFDPQTTMGPRSTTPAAYIINTGRSGTAGEHWVCFYNLPHHIEFFDSFGQHPSAYFPHYMYKKHLLFGTLWVQQLDSNYCGHHVLFFLDQRMRRVATFHEFLKYYYDPHLRQFNDRHVGNYCRA